MLKKALVSTYMLMQTSKMNKNVWYKRVGKTFGQGMNDTSWTSSGVIRTAEKYRKIWSKTWHRFI